MGINECFLRILTCIIMMFFHIGCYNLLSGNKKIIVNKKVIVGSIIAGTLFFVNTHHNIYFDRAIVTLIIVFIVDYFIFRENIKTTIIKSSFAYALIVLFEILLSLFIMNSSVVTLEEFDANMYYKCIFSLLTILFSYLLCKLKLIKKLIINIIAHSNKTYFDITILLISVSLLIITALNNTYEINKESYFANILTLVCIIILMCITIYNNYKAKQVEAKKDALLEFMTQYEKMIDIDRMNMHEILNNLLILKSYKNKNSKKYNDTLNEIIETYSNKRGESIKNIYNLPTGLKGIIYYRVNNMKALKIEPIISISKNAMLPLEKLSNKEYHNICKIVGILIDNAVEASKETKEKYLFIEIYKSDSKITINIENSFKNIVNINKMNKLNYSTKGKNRGLGLYIAKRLISKSKVINLKQTVNKYFISTIEIAI